MAQALTFALEMDIVLDVRAGGFRIEVPIKYVGDLHAIGYGAADLFITIPFQSIKSKLITSGRKSYLFNDAANRWETIPGDTPFFAGPSVFLGSDTSELTDLEVLRSETIDGFQTQVVSARMPGVEIGGAIGDLDVLYWIGVDDGLLRKVEANGFVEFGEEGVPGLNITIAGANATLAARFFDYGKSVDITTPELAFPRFSHKAFLLDDGRIFVTDGLALAGTDDPDVDISIAIPQTYDFEAGLWMLEDPASELLEQLRELWFIGHSSVKLSDGRILRLETRIDSLFGRIFEHELLVFDPGSNSWTPLPNPPTQRMDPELLLLDDGRVLVLGGFDIDASGLQPGSTPFVGTTEIFNPETGEWQEAATMDQPLFRQAAVLLSDGRVLVMGGTLIIDGTQSARAEIYDPATDTWTPTGDMDVERGRPEAVLLSDGRVLVTGDRSLDFRSVTGKAEIYDPDTGAWSSTGDMSKASIGHTLTLLPDGRVLATGGVHPTNIHYGVYSTTEIFYPASNSWSPGPELSEPRIDHSATLLPNGRVLLVGGFVHEDGGHPLSSMEVVTP